MKSTHDRSKLAETRHRNWISSMVLHFFDLTIMVVFLSATFLWNKSHQMWQNPAEMALEDSDTSDFASDILQHCSCVCNWTRNCLRNWNRHLWLLSLVTLRSAGVEVMGMVPSGKTECQLSTPLGQRRNWVSPTSPTWERVIKNGSGG